MAGNISCAVPSLQPRGKKTDSLREAAKSELSGATGEGEEDRINLGFIGWVSSDLITAAKYTEFRTKGKACSLPRHGKQAAFVILATGVCRRSG